MVARGGDSRCPVVIGMGPRSRADACAARKNRSRRRKSGRRPTQCAQDQCVCGVARYARDPDCRRAHRAPRPSPSWRHSGPAAHANARGEASPAGFTPASGRWRVSRDRHRRMEASQLRSVRTVVPRSMTYDRKRSLAAALVLTCTARHAASAQKAQSTGPVVARAPSNRFADSLYAAGDASAAEQQYRAVLSTEPNNTRALYMLAQLRMASRREAASLLERYTALVPSDAWGFIALGTARGRAGNISGALDAFDAAERLAPTERDVYIARARMLAAARHTDAAIASYARWTSTHSS